MVGFGTMGPGLAAAQLEAKKRRQAGGKGPGKKRGRGMLAIFGIFPLLAIPVIVYNLMAFVFVQGGDAAAVCADRVGEDGVNNCPAILDTLSEPMFTPIMVSGKEWIVTGGDLLILLSLLFLFVEILRSTSTGTATIMNHAISMLIFIVCLVEFLMFPNFATSVFFIITMMALLDVLAGVVVTIVSARRDFAVGEGFSG